MTLVQRAVGQDRLLAFAAIVVVVVVVSSWPLASPSNAQESQQRARFLSAAPCFACTLHASTAVAYVVSYTHTHTHTHTHRGIALMSPPPRCRHKRGIGPSIPTSGRLRRAVRVTSGDRGRGTSRR
ncbi:uncharacterized protein CCOS01_15349 [Colletotrichum costaricense]|uniref:Uncharacterized protein n=1 Tax=Colletotrichum costaricense TaxID=1209916 RepID=A0AAJ0DTJ4_9PEZI|nr:uncharacterized protein CCOS01_15349 [Colletotrichum costaricense]KAK1510518.1 hypothetical protein CCOS01_15349 [Colletotrichum costaricense]